MEHVVLPDQALRDKYLDLADQLQRPYLNAERKRAISVEMARLSFEIDMREKDV